jgi:anti-sigma factor RsiW
MSPRDHERYREDVGAYLLGALPDPDREAFERHLAGCVECREDVERLRPAADALPRSVQPLEPPASLKASLMEAIRADGAEPRPLGRRLADRIRLPWRISPAIAWAAAALLVVVGVATGFGVGRALDGDDVTTVAAQVDRTELPQARASLSLPEDGEAGAILRVNRMPSPGRGRVYQAWVQRNGEVVPQPTFEVDAGGAGAVALPGDLSNAEAVLVTRERRGGARTPSEDPIVTARL